MASIGSSRTRISSCCFRLVHRNLHRVLSGACLHRVADHSASSLVPRRLAAVLFVAPKFSSTRLDPVVGEGEKAKYRQVGAGELRGQMARKWKAREGTITAEEKILEEEEIRVTRMMTQDHVVNRIVTVNY